MALEPHPWAAAGLRFEAHLVYSVMQPEIASTNTDDLGTSLRACKFYSYACLQQKTLTCFSSELYKYNQCTDRTSRSHPPEQAL